MRYTKFIPALIFLSFVSLNACSLSASSVKTKNSSETDAANYRKEMRNFICTISKTARAKNPGFIVITQNGQNVAWDNDDDDDKKVDVNFFKSINGCGREDLFYGTDENWDMADDKLTPKFINKEFVEMCDVYKNAGLTVLAVDYCSSKYNIEDSYKKNKARGYLSFQAPSRNLDVIPAYTPNDENANNIKTLSEAENFLYLINPAEYENKADYISALSKTNYDVLIIDLFFDEEALTKTDVEKLKKKNNGGARLVICYMSIGEAENYRWYWKKSWKPGNPSFLCELNEDWEGNFKVKYWDSEWQKIICTGSNSYLSKILAGEFDGVYLDIIDAFEYFQDR